MSSVFNYPRPVPGRFSRTGCRIMKAVVTRGNGSYDTLEYRDVPVPDVLPGTVLVKVLAAGVNNTEINTRLGWYSETVQAGTNITEAAEALHATQKADGGWNLPTPFPFIQGTDCCGVVVGAYPGEDTGLVGKRGLVRPCMRPYGFQSLENIWMGSDFDGAFAEYVLVPASEFFPINSSWTDVELGSIPCAYGTAENMVHRAQIRSGTRVLIPGASGGVGSAAVQLCKRRGAEVIGMCGASKREALLALGIDRVLDRDDDPAAVLGEASVDVVIDNVGGSGFPGMLKVLKQGGVYVSSGAIGGPVVQLDLRTWYLKDIRMIGCTAWDEPVFPNLISYIEKNEIRPLVYKTFPLSQIAEAQKEFLKKQHVGKLVLLP